MKLTWIFAIAVTIWSCSGDPSESTMVMNSQTSDSTANSSYLVGITMKKKDSDTPKNVELIIYRTKGYPTCVGVSGLGNDKKYVPLKKTGSGEWKKGDDIVGTYERYKRAENTDLDITLHWTKKRGGMTENNMGDEITGAENSRLEYFSAKLNSNLYEYQHDVDGKLGITIGELAGTTPNQGDFDATCPSTT